MPNPPDIAAAPKSSPHMNKMTRRNWFGFPVLRLTTLIPISLSAVVFVFTLSVTWLAAELVNRQNMGMLADKAQVFLDATAGHFSNSGAFTEAAATEALTSALSFKTVMGEEALAIGWVDGDDISVIGLPQGAEIALRNDLSSALGADGEAAFQVRDNARGVLTRVHEEGANRFAITGVFDTGDLLAANEAVHQAALGLSLLTALATAAASYLLARVAISPLIALASRLAEGRTGNATMLAGQYLSSEILQIETILALRREDEKTRENMAQRLAQIERDQVLARLAATLAHEIRNPLAGIRNAFSTLRRFGDDLSVRKETLGIIEGGLDSLQRLTDVTLSTYRRRSGEGVVTATDIRDLALIVSPQVDQKSLELKWSIPDSATIVSDTDAVRQMLLNLLINACKASPEGGVVHVSASIEADGVRVSIADTGAGLPEGVRQHLQAGFSVNVADSRDLGLWVVHSLADELGASLSVESTVDRGTVVSVLFPAATESDHHG